MWEERTGVFRKEPDLQKAMGIGGLREGHYVLKLLSSSMHQHQHQHRQHKNMTKWEEGPMEGRERRGGERGAVAVHGVGRVRVIEH
jgi:hypothetical protein